MRLAQRKANTSLSFVDAQTNEAVLRLATDSNSLPLIGFRLYGATGSLVAECLDLRRYPEGLTVMDGSGEVLLLVPASSAESLQYCLYGKDGALLTSSDGKRTRIFPRLRMESAAMRP